MFTVETTFLPVIRTCNTALITKQNNGLALLSRCFCLRMLNQHFNHEYKGHQ